MPGVYAPPSPDPVPTAADVPAYTSANPPPELSRRMIDLTAEPIAADGVDAGSKHFTTVDPTVFPKIAAALDKVVTPLTEKVNPLSTVALKPGHFNAADRYKNLIGGQDTPDGGLVETYRTNVDSAIKIFSNMVTALKKLGEKYTTADDMANGNANDVQQIMHDAFAPLGLNVPTTVPGYTPPDTDTKAT